jgi:excisionase family DNA binding protein
MKARQEEAAPVRLLSVQEVAHLLQVPVATLYRWRFRREGPATMRIGRYLRYDPADVARWIETRKAVG